MWQDSYWHPAADEPLETAAFSPHTGIMVTAFGEAIDGVDMVWDATDLSRPQRLSQFEGGQPMALSPDGRTVATIAYSGQAALWNVADPRRPVKMTTLSDGDGSKLEELAFSPDGQILATARYDRIFLWDMASPARPRLLRALDAPVTSPAGDGPIPFSQRDLAFSPGGTILASATGTDQVTLWNVTDPAHAYRMATIDGAGDFIQAFAFSPRGNLLAAVTFHGTVLVLQPGRPCPPRTHRHGPRPADPRTLSKRVPATRGDAALCHLPAGQLRGGVHPGRTRPDRRRRPRGDERQLRARHYLRLARDRLRNHRRRHGRCARRRRLPARHSPRRPLRAGQPARQPRLARLGTALTRLNRTPASRRPDGQPSATAGS